MNAKKIIPWSRSNLLNPIHKDEESSHMKIQVKVPKDFCKQILTFDKSMRYAGVADKFGKVIMAEYRKGYTPLLSKQESVLSAMRSVIIMGTRKIMQPTLGKIVYAFTLYEKVKRATIPLTNNFVLMVSFDIEADHESIILKKILPFIQNHGLC